MKEEVQAIYEHAGFTGELPIGNKIGILVIDFQLGFTDPNLSPLAGDFSVEIEKTATILTKAREKSVPIFFCTIGYENEKEGGQWIKKAPGLKVLNSNPKLMEIDPRLNRQPNEVVIVKKYASAFAGTPIVSLLTASGIDTLFVTGTTTSGCVRASVVDAIQNGFIPFVIEDAVCDRAIEPHRSNLFDMKAKYAELITTQAAVNYLNQI
ncbi:isochorismatase family protein [Peribacillus saganii]|uniref:Isochorismatase family protein n=1 Tax=Peribacillus saganii TaxID=2303992 RepID=A0A372LTF9_9BACI|nr:isochorismatase family protein [Peribacillus saganii]RFU71473.1 isochorismatase family protein [Peribacillus saganii]